jgi:hypothetical protein
MPLFKRMHEMTWDHVHEEIQLLAIDISTMLFETTAHVPTYRDYYQRHDQRPHYDYMKTVLKVLTWARPDAAGTTRWLLKSPQHLEQFPVLHETFPDATYVVTHRDPVSVICSMVTMLAYSARMNVAHPDPQIIGRAWAERLAVMLDHCLADRDALPTDQTIHVRFDDFMADDIAMVRRIYDLAGQPFDDGVRAAMDAFMATHERGRFGTVVYDFADFGLDPREWRERLRPYSDGFGILAEHRWGV